MYSLHLLLFLLCAFQNQRIQSEKCDLYIYLEATLSNSTFTSLVHFYESDSLLIKPMEIFPLFSAGSGAELLGA